LLIKHKKCIASIKIDSLYR